MTDKWQVCGWCHGHYKKDDMIWRGEYDKWICEFCLDEIADGLRFGPDCPDCMQEQCTCINVAGG